MTATLVEFPTSFHKQESFISVISTNMEVDIDAKELADRMAAAEAMSALSSVVRVNPGDSPASPRTSKRIASRGTRGGGRGRGRKTNQGDKIPNSEAKKSRSRVRTNHDTTKSNVTDSARNKPTRAASKTKDGAQEQAPKRSPRRKSKSGQSEPETPTKTRTKQKNSSSEYGEMAVLEPQVTNASSTVSNIPSLPSTLSLTLPSLNIPSLGTLPTLGSIPIFHPDTNSGDKTKQDNKSLPFKKRRLINNEHSEDSEDQESKTEGAQTQERHGQAYIVTAMESPEARDKFYKLLEIDKSKAGKNHQEKRYIDQELYDKTIQAVESRKYERCPTGDAHFKDWAKGFSVKSGLDGVKVLLSNPDKLKEKRRKQEIQRRNRQSRRAESEQEEEDIDKGRKRPKKETKELPVLIKEKYFDEILKCHQEAKHSKEGTWRMVKDRWCMVTKQIITRFCQTCPTCNITQKKRTFQDPSTSDCSATKRACASTVADTEASWSSFSSSQTDETMPVISTEVVSGRNQYTPFDVMPEFLETSIDHSRNLPSDLQRVDLQTLDSMSATSSSFGHQRLSAPSFSVSPGYIDTRGTQMHQRFSCSSVDSSGSSSSFYHQETHGFLAQNSPIPSSMIQTTACPNLMGSRSQGTKTSQGLSTHFGQLETCESTVRNPVESTNVVFSGPLMTAMPGRGRDPNVRSQVPTLTFPSEAESKALLASSPTLTASSTMTQRWVASIQSEMTNMSTASLPPQGETRSRQLMQLVDSPFLSSSSSQRLRSPIPHTMGMSTMIPPSQDKNTSKELIPTSPSIRAASTETQGWVDPTQAQTAPIPQMTQTGAMSHRLPIATMPQAFTSAPGLDVYSLQEEDGQSITSIGQTLSKSAVFNTSSTPPLTYSQSSLGSYQTQTGIDVISRTETHGGQAPSNVMDHWNFPLSSYLPPSESLSTSSTPFTHHQVQPFHTLTVPSNVSSDHAYISMFNQPRPGLMSLATRPAHMSDQSLLHFYGQGQMSNNPRPGQVSRSLRQGQISKPPRQGQISNSPQPSPMSHCHRQGQILDSTATLNTHKLPLEANICPQQAHFPSHSHSQASPQEICKIPVFGSEEMYFPFHPTREFGLGVSGISTLDDANNQQTPAIGRRISTEQDLSTLKDLVPSCQSQGRSAECDALTSRNLAPNNQRQSWSAERDVLAQSISAVDHPNVLPKKSSAEPDVPKNYCSPQSHILPEVTGEPQTRAESDVFTQLSYTELTQSMEDPDLLLQWILEQTPGLPGDHNTPGLPREHHTPCLPGDHGTPGLPGDHSKRIVSLKESKVEGVIDEGQNRPLRSDYESLVLPVDGSDECRRGIELSDVVHGRCDMRPLRSAGIECGSITSHLLTDALSSVTQTMSPSLGQTVSPTLAQSVSPAIGQTLLPYGGQSVLPSVGQTMSPYGGRSESSVGQTVSPYGGQSESPSVGQTMSPYGGQSESSVGQTVSPYGGQSESPSVGQTMSPYGGQSVLQSVGQTVSPYGGQSESPSVGQTMSPYGGQSVLPSVGQTMLPYGGQSESSVGQSVSPYGGQSESPSVGQTMSPYGGQSESSVGQTVSPYGGQSESPSVGQTMSPNHGQSLSPSDSQVNLMKRKT